MKNQFFFLVIAVVLMMSCSSVPPEVEEDWMSGTSSQRNETSGGVASVPSVLSIEGNEWKLIEVYISGNDTLFRRDTLPDEMRNFFTLNIDAQNISGVGAPNRYIAPYTLNNSQIKIMPMLSTMMALINESENITEHAFFNYLQNASSWKMDNNNLELLSKTQDGSEARLVFSL